MPNRYHPVGFVFLVLLAIEAAGDRLAVQRREVFEFAEKPVVTKRTRAGRDEWVITFAAKDYCDVAVAIEDAQGNIARHLACGLLGDNAPPPLEKNSLKQTLVWDGKKDRDEYLDNQESLLVRISLGLRPQFERTLFWSPYRRADQSLGRAVAIQARPEGVYVYDGGQAVDHLRLFSHSGDYVRTIYPFPAEKLSEVKGLIWHEFPQDGQRLPIKPSYQMCTLLTSGNNALHIIFKDGRYFVGPMDPAHKGEHGYATTDLAIVGNRIALAANRLNRLSTDGTSGGLPIYGPHVDLRNEKGWYKATESALVANLGGYELLTNLRAHRFCLSPDGKILYLTRYIETYALDMYRHNYWHHGVFRMEFEGEREPTLFLGAAESGSDERHFNMPADVACDSLGRLYVADLGNHRIQVFTPEGKLVKTIPVEAPAQLAISPKGELYVFSWELLPDRRAPRVKLSHPFALRKFRPVDNPQLVATYLLPMAETPGLYEHCADVDFWTDPPTIWINPGTVAVSGRRDETRTRPAGILLLAEREKEGKLELLRDFDAEARETVIRTRAPGNNRQRLYCDPKRGTLYVGEDGFHFKDAIAIDPDSGKVWTVNLPFDAEDMGFDSEGLAYLRTPGLVARYDPVTWREVPWDYGEERKRVTYNSHSDRREADVVSGLTLPSNSGWHHGGLHVSPRGHLAVGVLYLYGPPQRGPRGQGEIAAAQPYTPVLYPGRILNAVYGCEYVHVWDKHGKLLYEDAIPGLGTLNGVAIDNEDNLYVLSAAPRFYNGKPWFNFLAGTLMKFRPGVAKIISDDSQAPIPVSPENRPARPPDLTKLPGNAWADGAEWFFPGIGWHGKNHGLGCGCRNTRFALDYYARSFAPEMDRYSIAVLDSAGNVITRIGRYGNVDDGMPLIKDGGPPHPRSIGGDEVSLIHGAYLAVHTDRRLFIADIGNYRISSVKLNYHTTARVGLGK